MRWLKYTVEQLPVVRPTKENEIQIAELVRSISSAKRSDPKADTTALEAEIDRLVYGLYGLTPEEIAVVEGASSRAAAVSSVPSAGDARERKPRRETNPKPVRAEDDDEYLD